ncbi:MAG TPA: hypothetical protein VFB03_01685 [Candidatus Saccharimonadales bacterium]|nr:hypothetical protein [Candidatus Saccharimonadales bacterium]
MPNSFEAKDGFIIAGNDLSKCNGCPIEAVVQVDRTQVMLVPVDRRLRSRFVLGSDPENVKRLFANCRARNGLVNNECGVN